MANLLRAIHLKKAGPLFPWVLHGSLNGVGAIEPLVFSLFECPRLILQVLAWQLGLL